MSYCWLACSLVMTSLLIMVDGSCAPTTLSDGLQKCLQYQSLNTYWQFPFVASSSYTNLCSNSTCLTYCYDLLTIPCNGEYYTEHLGDGKALKAAYLGFCDVNKTEIEAALTCGNQITNQNVLNAVSAFQTALQGYVDSNTINGTAICVELRSLLDTLTTLMQAPCSGDPRTLWTRFFNTVYAPCDSSLTPSFYTEYKDTTVTQCAGANSLPQFSNISFICLMMCIYIFENFM